MRILVGDVTLEVDDRGSGPPVLLLHGWPDAGRLWRHQVAALGDAGFRTIVPDLRGFGASDRPETVDAYGLPALVGDVLALLDALEVERAHVVGHDWGAALAWVLATLAPDRVESLAVLSVGHPAAFSGASLLQREKSWYMLLFQFEGVAEEWLSKDGWRNFRDWGNHPDADACITDLERPGALTASLGWYRANLPPGSLVAEPLELPPVQVPTMGVWSTGDMALTEAQMTGSEANVAPGQWRYERVEGAGHWMQLEAPDRVNELLLDFLPRSILST
jgi:pimeloyl-ACP methyl ester carboxylesterase